MLISLLIGIGAGLASAVIFYSATRGTPGLSLVLLLLTPLPPLIAGFGWGLVAAIAAGLASAGVMFVATGWPPAAVLFLALGLPTAILTYLAELARPSSDPARPVEWYPAGGLLAALVIYGGLFPLMILPIIGGTYAVLKAPMTEFLRTSFARLGPDLGMPRLEEAQLESLARLMIELLPGAIATYWLIIFTLNAYVAGRIVRASGLLKRDWPDIRGMQFPGGMAAALAAALLATFFGGTAAIIGTSFTAAFMFAFLMLGLAVVHALVALGRIGRWVLWVIYGSIALSSVLPVGPIVMIALTLLGLFEPVLKLRRRLVPPKRPTT